MRRYTLAGFVAGHPWTTGGQPWTADLPGTVATVSDCLTAFLPLGRDIEPWQQPLFEPWHRTLRQAARAAERAPGSHVLSMSVPADGSDPLTTMIEEWIGDLPHPIRINLAHPAAAPPGTIRGHEVLGFSGGRFHSWLCYRLDIPAAAELGVQAAGNALLSTLDDARRVADMANDNRGTPDGTPHDITWFPALITEHHDAAPAPQR
ncbi:hypothetical protein ACWT_4204 [Actinoplanes sp. SE50]|uniref:hypothetical protein n=1 Tax=unclassified Actinoplanes TaxID=2626549 RepID=UPI00023EC2CC|nr:MULTISPECIES: hypothetical protein [unclassified Actinoplanes]AEV85224.1 hypothetical protein ACPL_4333 [Actinoplanes sp. SE50/110]ATO83619.1 hypothetical protein ACWT_4204 [Actinoplanes sp. SE50]SLM01027.1 hypothetical protein ACSP50_4260 [Actinoplanes sp. SE50/110]